MLSSVNSDSGRFKDKTFDLIRILCKQKNGLKICHINAQSLVRKMDELRYIFEGSGIDIICVSETWFSENMADSLFKINGFKIYRADRQGHAGGVAIFVKNSIVCKVFCKSTKDSVVEYLFLSVVNRDKKIFILGWLIF